jgi:hypothetical protein
MATLMGLFQTVTNIKKTLDNWGDASRLALDVAERIEKIPSSIKTLNTAFESLDVVLEAQNQIRENFKTFEPDLDPNTGWAVWAQWSKNMNDALDQNLPKYAKSYETFFISITKNAFEAANSFFGFFNSFFVLFYSFFDFFIFFFSLFFVFFYLFCGFLEDCPNFLEW